MRIQEYLEIQVWKAMNCRIIIAFALVIILLSFTPMFTGPVTGVEVTGRGISMPATGMVGIITSIAVLGGLAFVYKKSKRC